MKGRPRIRIVIAYRRARTRLAQFLTGSAAVHAALLAVILIAPSARHRATPIEDAMVVALVGPIASAPPASSGAVSAPDVKQAPPPPAPKPQPPPKEARAVREVPDPKPKAKLVKIKNEPPKDPRPDAPESSKTPEPPGPAGPGKPDAPPGASTRAAVGSAVPATVGGGDSALGWYAALVKAALESAWVKPYIEDLPGTASVVLAFDIARDGTARNIRIETSSGIQALDRSAQRAAIEAGTFPAVPPSWTGDTIPVTMRFELSPESH